MTLTVTPILVTRLEASGTGSPKVKKWASLLVPLLEPPSCFQLWHTASGDVVENGKTLRYLKLILSIPNEVLVMLWFADNLVGIFQSPWVPLVS